MAGADLHALQRAHRAARLRGTLEEAMRDPLLARCLEITAVALAKPRAAVLPPASATPRPSITHQSIPPSRDRKRAGAGDDE